MLKVYRFEHKYIGCGPLCVETSFRWNVYFKDHQAPCETDAFNDFEKFVKNRDDVEDRNHPEFFFGANNLDWLLSLLRSGAEEALEEYDFELMEFEVTDDYFVFDDGQVYFNKSKAKRVA